MDTAPAVALGLLALATTDARAQSYSSSPPDLLSKSERVPRLLAPQSGRRMHLDGELRGRARTIREITYRPIQTFWGVTAPARSWSRVTVDISHCLLANVSTDFGRNPTSTPTRVFDGPVSWPPNASTTTVWGGPNGATRFAFSQPWIYTGTEDLCIDHTFRGGKLLVPGNWNDPGFQYSFDGYHQRQRQQAGKEYGAFSGRGGCVDGTSRNGLGAWARFLLWSYARGATPNDAVQANCSVSNVGSQSLVTHLFGLSGSPVGNPFLRVPCNRLHVDLGRPTALLFSQAGANGLPLEEARITLGPLPYAASSGVELWYQAAWIDTQAPGRLLLSNAVTGTPAPQPRLAKRLVLRSVPRQPNELSDLVPAVRYTH